MANSKRTIFYVPCRCIENVSKLCAEKQLNLVGIRKVEFLHNESRMCTMAFSAIIGPTGHGRAEPVYFNYCPFCGAQIIVEEPDEGVKNAELDPVK